MSSTQGFVESRLSGHFICTTCSCVVPYELMGAHVAYHEAERADGA